MATFSSDNAVEVLVRDLKDHLAESLRPARSGEEIMVTSRGKPVGQLVEHERRPRSARST